MQTTILSSLETRPLNLFDFEVDTDYEVVTETELQQSHTGMLSNNETTGYTPL